MMVAEDLKDILRDTKKNQTSTERWASIFSGLNIVANALIMRGLKETAKQFNKLTQKM